MDISELLLADVVCVVGTDTGVGKTIATAAIAAILADVADQRHVSVHKLVQAGPSDSGLSDSQDIASLLDLTCDDGRTSDDLAKGYSLAASGVPSSARLSTTTHTTLRFPMAPRAAALREGVPLPPVSTYVRSLTEAVRQGNRVVVEGSGGLLVELDSAGATMADVAVELQKCGLSVSLVVVCRSGLGTQNHTALTLEALHTRAIQQVGILVGSLEPNPAEVTLSNLDYLRELPVPFLGAIPQGASTYSPATFRREAHGWLQNI